MVTKIEKLEWDSAFFNLNIKKVVIEQGDLGHLDSLSKSEADLLYVFSENRSIEIEKMGGELVDIKYTFRKHVDLTSLSLVENIRIYTGDLNQTLIDLAIESGMHSRFKKDKKLSIKFEELYTLWIKRSIDKSFADEVLIAVDDMGKIIGLSTIKIHNESANIGIIATNENYRGRGIGASLLKACENWCFNRNVMTLDVATQQQNKGACSFYEKNNFKLLKVEYIYHLWFK